MLKFVNINTINSKKVALPLFANSVSAGFPSPAEDFSEDRLDLNEYIIKHPAATFFVRVKGSSMKNAGIHSGDILVIDKSLDVKAEDVVVASIDGEFTVKRVVKMNERLYLKAENENYEPILIKENDDFQIFGVVTFVIKKLEARS